MSTLRVPTTAWASPVAGSVSSAIQISKFERRSREGAATTRNCCAASFRDEARLIHQLRVEGVVLLKEFYHVGPSEEDRLERLLFHVVLEFRRLRDLLEQIDV